ncbi:MAG TPA: MerR family transcriptional regulator [Thermodesulfovibrionales bacterium]|jgi:DNA-binding transcriptional MerR regulator|nr:MerR family transcriptional regulator [Thermodesulfovibrionales bacterium]
MNRSSVENIVKARRPYPDKLFYKIGEVSKIADVEPYVLRYWETEFPFLRPRKNKSGQRVYVKKDLELVLQIKKMLHEERYTIEGVRKKFGENEPPKPIPTPVVQSSPREVIENVKKRLRAILSRLQ